MEWLLPLSAQVGGQSSLPAAQAPQPQATISNLLDRSLKNSHFFVFGQNFAVLAHALLRTVTRLRRFFLSRLCALRLLARHARFLHSSLPKFR
jgi:hypothetical protein